MRKKRSTSANKLWDLFSKLVRQGAADENGMVRCVTCGVVKHWKEMQAGHFVHARKTNHVSYDKRNVNPQCPRCNKWLHGNLARYTVFLVERYGAGIVDELHNKKRDSKGLRRFEFEELAQQFQMVTA
jgi:hypothetical protein